MKHETILVPVKCSEQLPKRSGAFHTSQGYLYFSLLYKEWSFGEEIRHPDFWYEEQKDKYVLSEKELKELADKIWDRGASGQPFMNEELDKPTDK